MFNEEVILSFLLQYAYLPYFVYAFVVIFMLMSGFGLPIPEEVVLVGCGLIGYMSLNPGKFPPPTPGAQVVDVYFLATVCLIAVLISDTIVFLIGKKHGVKVFYVLARIKFFFLTPSKKTETSIEEIYQHYLASPIFSKINELFQNHGMLAVGIFRFTPGVRFPGHLSCGMMGVSLWKFLLVDFVVAAFSVPTQVLIVSFNGEVILEKVREFKMIILGIAAIVIAIYLVRKYRGKRTEDKISNNT